MRNVRRAVDHHHGARQEPLTRQLAQLKTAAAVGGREASKVEEHDVAAIEQGPEQRLPRIIAAEELVDAIAAIGIGRIVDPGEVSTEVRRAGNEPVPHPTAHERDDVGGIDNAGGEIGGRDQLDAARQPPPLGDGVEQPFDPPLVSEHAQQQEAPADRRVGRGGPEPESNSHDRPAENKSKYRGQSVSAKVAGQGTHDNEDALEKKTIYSIS